jgi:hypothetical protein
MFLFVKINAKSMALSACVSGERERTMCVSMGGGRVNEKEGEGWLVLHARIVLN